MGQNTSGRLEQSQKFLDEHEHRARPLGRRASFRANLHSVFTQHTV